jgi:hypothetical protein
MKDSVRTEIIVVLDRSGSMGNVVEDTIGGFNQFVKEQKEAPGEAWLTLAQFDDRYDLVHNRLPISVVPDLEFRPRGSTALLDGIGKTITTAQETIKNQRPGPDNVICVVITDGGENASKEYKLEQIKNLIEKAEKEDEWRFVFLGANQDAFSEAGGMGIRRGATLNYSSTGEGTANAYASISKGLTNYRTKMSSADNKSDMMNVKLGLDKQDYFDADDIKIQEDLINKK